MIINMPNSRKEVFAYTITRSPGDVKRQERFGAWKACMRSFEKKIEF